LRRGEVLGPRLRDQPARGKGGRGQHLRGHALPPLRGRAELRDRVARREDRTRSSRRATRRLHTSPELASRPRGPAARTALLRYAANTDRALQEGETKMSKPKTWRTLYAALLESARTTAMRFTILIGALTFVEFINVTTMPPT